MVYSFVAGFVSLEEEGRMSGGVTLEAVRF